jgi:hypothetical protein
MPDEIDDILNSLVTAKRKPARPVGREKFVPANSSWSVADINKIKDFYRTKTGRDLPVRNQGQGNIHNSQGWDHRNAADVALNPTTPEGQELLNYLRQNNIPFNAFGGPARSKTGKVASTGPHIHVGLPSSSTKQRYAIGTTLGEAPAPADDIDAVLDELISTKSSVPPIEPRVTSTVREDDAAFDMPLEGAVPPIEFKPFEASDLPFAARVAAGGARIAGANMQEVPESSPLRGGKLVKATVKTAGNHSYPNANEMADALLDAMGAGEVGRRYRAETGRNLVTPEIGLEELKRGYDPESKSYSFEVQPTSADIRIINAYSKGGVGAAQAEIAAMRGEVKSSDEKVAQGRAVAQEVAQKFGMSEGNGPIAKGLGDAAIGGASLLNNVQGFVRDPKDSARDAQIIENASAAIPQEKTATGRIVRGITGAIGSAPRYMNPAAPVVAMAENLQKGKSEAVKAGMTMGVPSGVSRGAGAALNSAGAVTRQLTARGMGGATNVITDKVSGSDKNPVESFVEGALLPVGKKKFQHRDFGEVVEAPNQAGVPQGKVKVVDAQSVEHVIQKPTGTGAGNQRAIPVREKAPDAPVVPIRMGQRATPKNLEAAGLPKGSDTTYDVLTNRETLEKAQAAIKEKGVDRSISDLIIKRELTAEDTATGVELLRTLQKTDIKRAAEVADHLSRKLTEAGQAVQAASIISRLSPEGILLTAQRQMKSGQTLAPDQAKVLTETATKVREAEAKVSTLEKQIAELSMRATTRAPRPKLETLQERLAKAESDARARLAARIGVGKGGQVGASTIPLDIADYAIIGASKLAQKGVTFAKWSQDMVGEFGDEIKPKLQAIYRESYRQYDATRKELRKASERRGVTKGKDLPDVEVEKLVEQRVQARKDARTASAELARRFEDLTLTRGQKVKRVAGDVLNIPKTLKSSVDLSALRQGAMWAVTHPGQGTKLFFGKQLKAMREKNFDKYVDELMSDPDYPVMQRAGLELTTTPKSGALSAREEAFMSKIAGKLPGVKQSERAYTTFIDTARVSWFKQLKAQADDAALKGGKKLSTEDYKTIANFVNIGTGRGNLGKGALNNASPILNALFFAPKYAASKVQIFDPRVYARLPQGARRTAMRQAVQYFGTIATVGLLLKHGFNQQVTTDPEESEFMKLRMGNTRYDLAFGQGQYVTLAARLFKNAQNWTQGKDDGFGKTAEDNLKRFLRYKLAPIPASVLNVAQGKNAVGEKTSMGKEAIELVTPLYLNDLYKAFQEEGLTGVAKTAPGFVGVGVNTYKREEKRGAPRKDK